MSKLLIAVATYNRPHITELSLAMLREAMGSNDALIVYDDCSSAYSVSWLKRYADEVIRMPQKGGIERIRARNFRDFQQSFQDFDFLYTTDNDAIHDPGFSHRLRGLYGRYSANGVKLPVCLYNSKFHNQAGNTLWQNGEVCFRKTAPGISQMFDRDMAEMIVTGLNLRPQLETQYGYDYHLPQLLSRPFVQSEVSYLEHFARDTHEAGIHAKNSGHSQDALADFERDRALNPTSHLRSLRPVVIDYILNGKADLSTAAAPSNSGADSLSHPVTA
ncbi:glycosyltransferase family 2 protein [Ampullimonas aquatilis]|uniref:glycosyltransferase family 2 protein n=1 Tax=Ampullimonas aquatilis TaxID=1341549 RepID=UPI003C769B26